MDLQRDRKALVWRADVDEVIQGVLNRFDVSCGEAFWVRQERMYGVPYHESRDYFITEAQALEDYLNRWRENNLSA